MSRPILIAAALTLAFASLACSGEEESEVVGADVGSGGDAAGDDRDSGQGVELAMSYQFRFDSMVLDTSKSASAAYDILNSLLAPRFDPANERPALVLLDIVDLDVEANTFRVRAGSGIKTAREGEFAWDEATPDVYYDGTVDAESGVLEATIDTFVFIVNGVGDPPAQVPLPIEGLEFRARVAADEAGRPLLRDGTLAGRIERAAIEGRSIEAIEGVPAQPLTELLGIKNLDTDADNDGTPDSWSMAATFRAVPAAIAD